MGSLEFESHVPQWNNWDGLGKWWGPLSTGCPRGCEGQWGVNKVVPDQSTRQKTGEQVWSELRSGISSYSLPGERQVQEAPG